MVNIYWLWVAVGGRCCRGVAVWCDPVVTWAYLLFWCHGSNLQECPPVFSPVEVSGFGSLRYMQLQRESQFDRQGLALKGWVKCLCTSLASWWLKLNLWELGFPKATSSNVQEEIVQVKAKLQKASESNALRRSYKRLRPNCKNE